MNQSSSTLDLFALAKAPDPFSYYKKWRKSQGNIIYCDALNGYMVLGFEQVQQLSRDDAISADVMDTLIESTFPVARRGEVQPLIAFLKHWLFYADPPFHSQLRARLMPLFETAHVSATLAVIEKEIEKRLNKMERSQMEWMASVANPLRHHFLAAWFDLPMDVIASCCKDIACIERFMMSMLRTPDVFGPALEALTRFEKRFNRLDQNHQLSATLRKVFADCEAVLPKQNWWMLFAFLCGAGSDTVYGMLGNTVMALTQHHRAIDLAHSEHDVIDEVFRLYPTVHMVVRRAKANVTIDHITIEKNQNVYLCLAAANRDEAFFQDAEQFIPGRTKQTIGNLTFGYGAHLCLGKVMATQLAELFFKKWREQISELSCVDVTMSSCNGLILRFPSALVLSR